MVGMTVYDTTAGTTVGNLGMSDVKFPKPVFHGDTLRAETRILSVRPSQSRPGQGIVEFEHTAFNQNNEVVGSCRRFGLMLGKPSAEPTPAKS
jgi:acyl dehydratase